MRAWSGVGAWGSGWGPGVEWGNRVGGAWRGVRCGHGVEWGHGGVGGGLEWVGAWRVVGHDVE